MAIPGSDSEGIGAVRLRTIIIPASESWTPPTWAIGHYATVHTVGPGGSGGHGVSSTTRVSGGGAGGHALKRALLLNMAYTAVVGAGGAGVGGTTMAAGNPGAAATTFTGDVFALTANPGGGGDASTTLAVTGGAGGIATGGDENYTGGDGGDCASNNTSISGGGAIGWSRTGFSAGDITAASRVSPGAGLGGPSVESSLNDADIFPANGIVNFQNAQYFGRGGKAYRGNGVFARIQGIVSEFGAGGGALYEEDSSPTTFTAPPVGCGGGSGGVSRVSSTNNVFSAAGGDGVIVIEVEV